MDKKIQFKRCTSGDERLVEAYVDVTDKIKDIFGDIVKKAVIEVGTYYGFSSGSLEEWKESISYEEHSLIAKIGVDGVSLYIEYTNGKIVEFITSEWGSVQELKSRPEILE